MSALPPRAAAPRRLPGAHVYLRTMLLFAAFWAAVAAWKTNPILLPSPLAVVDAAIGLASGKGKCVDGC